jgi:glycosyltransferase involved in cell wall biosynthesis
LRLALLLAAPFPLRQGSQAYVADQARALAAAGARPEVVCYGAGDGRELADVPVVRAPRRRSPQALRSSAHPRKVIADRALRRTLVEAHRREPYDAVLAHNSEAAALALLARRGLGVPVVYVVHTLLRHELSAYGPAFLARGLDAAGAALERALARRADAVLALSREAEVVLGRLARGPVARIPPGLDPAPDPDPSEREAACRRFRLEPGGFALYAGNLDRYQDLDLLDHAAALVPDVPVVVATHDATGAAFRCLRVIEVPDRETVRTLTFACAFAVLPRRRPGGFPIKLLNFMEAGRAVVAHRSVAEGLEHARSAWLLPDDADAGAWAAAIRRLREQPERAETLGRAARAHLEHHHAWPALARDTLDLVRAAGATGRGSER